MSTPSASNTSTGQSVEVIGIGLRAVAYFIDINIISFLSGCFSGMIGPIAASAGQELISYIALLIQCVILLMSISYFILFWTLVGGRTPGKMILGIKIISVDGSPITFGQALLRYIGHFISYIPACLGFAWVSFDEKRQGWADKIAKTYVVRKDVQFSSDDTVTFVPSDSKGIAVTLAILLILAALGVLTAIGVILLLFATTWGYI
ncbi:MAG: RDD family protein [Chloroflexota bacterium]